MVGRASAGPDLQSTAATLTTSNAILQHPVKTSKSYQHTPTTTPLPIASPSETAFDVLLVIVSVVSTLFLVTLVLLVLVLRLLRRVTAAAATASAARHAHTRHSTASEEDDSADAEPQREVSSTTEDAQQMSDDVREQQPLLSQPQQQRNQLAQTRHDAQQQQQQRRRRRRRRQRQRQRIPASPSLFNALRFVLGFSGHHDRLSSEEEQQGFYYSLRSHSSSSSSSRAYSRHGRPQRHRASRRNRRHASFDNEHGEAGVEASRLAAPRATHRHAHPSSQADHTRSPGQPLREPTEHQRELAQAEHQAHAAATAVASDGEAAMPFHATTQKDLVVFNTTHDSRYRLLQRIGMGAFSSVYLVQHKTTGQKYALKYILCKDDRERLAALRECEVMHSLQGHPQVIRIVDMFMNYQFQSGGGGFGKPAASVAGASITRHPTGLAPAVAPTAAARAAPSLSSVTRPSQPWQVTSTGNPQLRNMSPHVARSLTQSPSLWARPNATPTSPLLLCGSSSPHAASATSFVQQSSQQHQQQKQQLSPLLPSANAPTSQFRPTVNTRQTAGAGTVDAAAAFSRPSYAPSSAPNPVTAALLHSAVASPATPSSPVHNPPTTGAARTTWVGVQLQGLQDAVMAKVSTATELEDAEVATALRARLRTAGADSLRGDGDDAVMRAAEQRTSMRRSVDYSVSNNYSTNNNRNRNGEEDDETDEADGASELDGSGVDSDHLTDPDNAPLILSAADTERLLMDARLLQQRRHRQRAHHRRLRQQKKSSAPDATNSTTLPVARGRGAAALSEFGETRSMSLSSLHQQQQQQQGLQQISVQHTSRSSSSVSRAMNRPHDGSLYGPPRGLPSPTTSSCSNTRGSQPTANVPSPCTYMPQQQQQQPSATALRYNVDNNNNNNSNSRFGNYTTKSGAASAAGPVNYSTAPHNSSNAKNARDLISSTEARASPQPQPQPSRQHDVPLTENDPRSPLKSNAGTRSTSSRRNVDVVSERSESSVKSNVSAGERRLSDEEAKRHNYSRHSEGSKVKKSTCSSSSDNTTSGSEEEPIQPIRRILVPPPSYMHPPPGFAPSSPIEGKRQEGAASPMQPSSPTSYVSRNRYANFTMNADAALADNINTTGADAQDTTTAAAMSTASAAEVNASRRVSPALELSAVGGEAVGVHEDVDAPSPAAAAAAAAASAAATEAAKARASYAPRKQTQQQQQQNFPSPALSYAPAASTSLTSFRPANSYAPARAAAGALSPAAQSHAAASEAEVKKAVAASNPASPAGAPTPTATQQTIPEAEMTKPGETEQTIESEMRTPSPAAASGVAEATNRSGDAVKSNSYPISLQVNNYAPARDSRVSHYINPYLERACGGEVVPPPRTSYAPGGGVRYNGLVAPASTAPVASYAPPSTPSATVTAAAATSGCTSAVCHRGPIVRAWNDGSALAQPTTKAVTTTATTAATRTTIEEEVKQISAGADHSTEPSTTKAEQEPLQQSTAPSSLITRNTYAPLRYGNLAQSTTTAVSAKPERTSTPASPLAPEAQSTTPAGTGTPVSTPAALNEVAVGGSAPPAPLPAPSTVGASSANSSSGGATCKVTPGRLSVSAAIRCARAGQQGERMHLNDGKPHVHVPTPNPEGGLVPPRPFTNPNELNRTHVVYGHLRNERGEGSNEGSEQDAMTQSNGTFAYPNYTYSNNYSNSNSAHGRNGGGDVTAYVDAPTPQKPLYTNLGVTLTEEAPPVAESAAVYPHPHTAVYSNSTHTTAAGAHGAGPATATSHLFRDTAGAASGYAGGVPSYGATNARNNNNNNNNNGSTTYATYAPRGATYAPAVRYANAGNPTLWCAYGQPGGAAIGPASVAAARATAAVLRGSNGGNTVNDTDNDSDGSREAKKYHGDATTVDGTATSRKHNKNGDADDDKNSSAAGTASTTQSNSSGSLTQDVRDTGYLCLVMEYHPMGDLCHYVLRAKQQLALQQQQQQEQPQQQSPYYMLRNSVSHNTFDARTNASPNTPTPSDNSSVLYAATNAAGASYNNNNNLHGDPNSPTVLLGSSTASWMAAAAAASWRMRPAASRSDPNLAVAASAAIGNGNGNIDATTGRTRGEEDDKRDPTSRNPLTEPQLLSIAYQLSSVLDHMHHQSPPIIHRDLKPENILIKGELTEFLEDVPAEAVLGLNGVAGPGSQCASKPASPLSPAAAAASASGPHGTGQSSLKENGNNTSTYQRADRASATPQSPSIPSNRGLSLNPAATAATAAAAGPAAGSTPGLSLAAPPPIRITRAVVPIVVTDFGLAMLQEHHSGHRSGSRGGGTRPYIAPECWQGATCTASDMWSLGCVLYALATTRLTARTVRLMSEEAKRDGFASRMLNDIISQKYSLAFASFVVSLLVVDPAKRPTAAQAAQCFLVTENEVRFDSSSPFFSNVLDL